MYRVSLELQKHDLKFGKKRHAVGTRGARGHFHRFHEFFQAFTGVSIYQ